ncbi:unnamed protein product [Schistosoma margrebowiei]|uniref:Uncharacterized protein n=1 Tax=Schistosoma margrebowiei TaxID=48269 RepID=A0A183N611_9TREM|nr:unnamed protein product [Schistosoma margrebowiei]
MLTAAFIVKSSTLDTALIGAVFTQEPPLDKEPDQNKESTNHLLKFGFDEDDVLKALGTLNMEKSTGPDELYPKILRHIV